MNLTNGQVGTRSASSRWILILVVVAAVVAGGYWASRSPLIMCNHIEYLEGGYKGEPSVRRIDGYRQASATGVAPLRFDTGVQIFLAMEDKCAFNVHPTFTAEYGDETSQLLYSSDDPAHPYQEKGYDLSHVYTQTGFYQVMVHISATRRLDDEKYEVDEPLGGPPIGLVAVLPPGGVPAAVAAFHGTADADHGTPIQYCHTETQQLFFKVKMLHAQGTPSASELQEGDTAYFRDVNAAYFDLSGNRLSSYPLGDCVDVK